MAAIWDFTNKNPYGRFALEEGADFTWVIHPVDQSNNSINMGGWAAKMQVRRQPDYSTILLELSTDNGYITIGDHATYGSNTILTINYPGSGTGSLNDWGVAYYDIKLTDSIGQIGRLMEGQIEFSRQVTV